MPTPSDEPAATPTVPSRAAVRAEARRMATVAGHRRVVAPRCWVGHPGAWSVGLPVDADTSDAGLLADLVERALDGVDDLGGAGGGPPLAWVTRSGDLVAGDGDLAWLRAARAGFGHHGVTLGAFLVIGRHGYADLLAGTTDRWSRVRASRAAPPPPAPPWGRTT